MAAGEKRTAAWTERTSGQERLKKTTDIIIDTQFPNEDIYLYEKKTRQSYCGRRRKYI